MVALKVAQYFQEVKALQDQLSGANEQPPDPLIELKKQELSQSAQRDQMDSQLDQAKLTFDQQREQNDMQIDQAKLAQADKLAAERNAVAMSKMIQTGGQRGNQTQ